MGRYKDADFCPTLPSRRKEDDHGGQQSPAGSILVVNAEHSICDGPGQAR